MCVDDISGRLPRRDELWELDIDTRRWTLLDTSGKTPGPRAGHSMFAFGGALYVWGGAGPTSEIVDARLYRLHLGGGSSSLVWEIAKTKNSMRPPPREEHAGVLYRGKYYITGGTLADKNLTDDLWCLNMSNLKWSALRCGPMARHCHNMWAARGKLYVLGGRIIEKHIQNPIKASHSIDDFHSYDIETRSWSTVDVFGDRPLDISEYTVLPLYHGQEDREDPYSVIVWGGYCEADQTRGTPSKEQLQAKYGDEWKEMCVSYRNRMLRFDTETLAWTLLKPTRELLPKAQSFAAEIQSTHGQTRLLIGGGYGFTADGKTPDEAADDIDPVILAMYKMWDTKVSQSNQTPAASRNIYEVTIADERGPCSALDDLKGKSWAWKFFDVPGEKRPSVHVDVSACSPTLHTALDLTFEDFLEPACRSVRPDDDSTLLGVRMKLHNLQGRKDLNGQVGRCGPWLEDKGRYQIFLSAYEPGGPASLSVKASNLLVAEPLKRDGGKTLTNLVRFCNGRQLVFPEVSMHMALPPEGRKKRPFLDRLLEGDEYTKKDGYMLASDTYYGPVSAGAQAILRAIAAKGTAFKRTLVCAFTPPVVRRGEGLSAEFDLFAAFYSRLKEKDSRRVKKFEADYSRKRRKHGLAGDGLGPWIDILGPWLKIVVTLDGVVPKIQRELIVSPDISMQNLHHQVLCPAIGWTNNYHCYAFRRIYGNVFYARNKQIKREEICRITSRAIDEAVKMMHEECWIGPKTSTALDAMFQPLYIGGALANDKKMSLGDLFTPDEQGETNLQYVHDFGDWWSHTICVSKYVGPAPDDASVAHLVSGQGGCPPEDTGGIDKYCLKMGQLMGKLNINQNDAAVSDGSARFCTAQPSSERWWDLLNTEVRAKLNGPALSSPLDFDLRATRSRIDTALRRPTQKVGHESDKLTNRNWNTGLASESHAGGVPLRGRKDPTSSCAVCGVTVALKTCSKCNSIAFCSREHQVQNWPEHKAECKRIRKEMKEDHR